MNTAAKTFIIAFVAVAASAAIGVSLADRNAAPVTEVVKLERVVVIGNRADTPDVAQLPPVVIEGRHSMQSALNVASARKSAPHV